MSLCSAWTSIDVNMTEMDEAGYELVKGQILDCASGVDTLCIPIPAHGAPKHWTLLVKKGDQWHYYDTFEGGHPECLKYAHEIVKLFEGENAANIKLECRNHVRQKGADCGYFVIAYMEIEASPMLKAKHLGDGQRQSRRNGSK